eukprot:CAMPEP_0119055994 /NCGR_PEP_ID=MMETSP1178-20130426/708_1 /TAXON_ID=33656 /ORGANISM="unid sp, Strain CCMP2000" /LENGTH=202 /DNA_ID=CAMNT_0007036669 /DNA_START=1 /DNA_END=610 /DNA_ORIENTATION=-
MATSGIHIISKQRRDAHAVLVDDGPGRKRRPADRAGDALAAPMMMATSGVKVVVPDKKVWVSWIDAADAKPGTINSGFRYGQEIAIVCDPKGGLFAMSNKMPPTGQPTTFAKFGEKGTVVEPITLTEFSTKTGKQVGTWCPSPVGRLLIGRLTSPSDIPVFPVRKQGNSVQVQINVNAKAQFESKYWRGILDAQGKVDGGYY